MHPSKPCLAVLVGLAVLSLTTGCPEPHRPSGVSGGDTVADASVDAEAGAEEVLVFDVASETAADAVGVPDALPDAVPDAAPDALPDAAPETEDTSPDIAPVSGVCPSGPFAAAPFAGNAIQAAVIPGSSSSLNSGGLVEGPVWIDGTLYLSSFAWSGTPSNILALQPDGSLDAVISNSGSNGLAVDSDGMIVAATQDDGGLSRYDPATGARTVIVNSFEGTRLNSPNDLSIAADGHIFFTDPDWQAPQPQPQPVQGVYRVTPAGEITLVDGSLNKPNGIALSNDESWLYVGHPGGMVRYAVSSNDLTVTTPGQSFGTGLSSVDGLAMDCAGNIYVTQPSDAQIVVLAPDGSTLGTIGVAPSVTNAAFGGPDGRTLYITAGNPAEGDAVYSVELQIPGRPY